MQHDRLLLLAKRGLVGACRGEAFRCCHVPLGSLTARPCRDSRHRPPVEVLACVRAKMPHIHTKLLWVGCITRAAQDCGLVPVVEPEILIDGAHSQERFGQVTEQVGVGLRVRFGLHESVDILKKGPCCGSSTPITRATL